MSRSCNSNYSSNNEPANGFWAWVTIINNTNTDLEINGSAGAGGGYPNTIPGGGGQGSWNTGNANNTYQLKLMDNGSPFSSGLLAFGQFTPKVGLDRGDMPDNQQWFSLHAEVNGQTFDQSGNGGGSLPANQTDSNTITLTFNGTKPAFSAPITLVNNTTATLTITPTLPQTSSAQPGETLSWTSTDPKITYALNWSNLNKTTGYLSLDLQSGVNFDRGPMPLGVDTSIRAVATATANGTSPVSGNVTQSANAPTSGMQLLSQFDIGGPINITFSGTWPTFKATAKVTNSTDADATINPALPAPLSSTVLAGQSVTWDSTDPTTNQYTLTWNNYDKTKSTLNFSSAGVAASRGSITPSPLYTLETDLSATYLAKTGGTVTNSTSNTDGSSMQLTNDFVFGGEIDLTFKGNWPVFKVNMTVNNNTDRDLTLNPALPAPLSSTIPAGGSVKWTSTSTSNTYSLSWAKGSSDGQIAIAPYSIGVSRGGQGPSGGVATTIVAVYYANSDTSTTTVTKSNTDGSWIQLGDGFALGGDLTLTFAGTFPNSSPMIRNRSCK